MSYRRTRTSTIERLADGAMIPPDPLNRDYCDYLLWLADGNVPGERIPDPPPTPSTSPVERLRTFLAQNPDVARELGL